MKKKTIRRTSRGYSFLSSTLYNYVTPTNSKFARSTAKRIHAPYSLLVDSILTEVRTNPTIQKRVLARVAKQQRQNQKTV